MCGCTSVHSFALSWIQAGSIDQLDAKHADQLDASFEMAELLRVIEQGVAAKLACLELNMLRPGYCLDYAQPGSCSALPGRCRYLDRSSGRHFLSTMAGSVVVCLAQKWSTYANPPPASECPW